MAISRALTSSSSTSAMSSSSKSAADLNPRSTHYEFFGPPGAFAISIGVPATAYALYFGCSEQTGGCYPPIDTDLIVSSLSDLNWWKSLWDTEAAIAYLGWYAFTVVAWAILPGDWVSGTTMRNGQTKQYKINGTCYSPSMCLGATSLLYSVLHHVVGPWYRGGDHLPRRTGPPDIHLRTLDWSPDRRDSHVCGPGHLLLRLLFPPWRAPRTRRKLWKLHLRRAFHSSCSVLANHAHHVCSGTLAASSTPPSAPSSSSRSTSFALVSFCGSSLTSLWPANRLCAVVAPSLVSRIPCGSSSPSRVGMSRMRSTTRYVSYAAFRTPYLLHSWLAPNRCHT